MWFSKKNMDSLCGKTYSKHGFQRVKEKNRPWFMQKNRVIDGFMHENRPGFVQKNWLGSRFSCINRVDAGFSCTNHTGFMQKNRTWFSCIVHTRTMPHSVYLRPSRYSEVISGDSRALPWRFPNNNIRFLIDTDAVGCDYDRFFRFFIKNVTKMGPKSVVSQ